LKIEVYECFIEFINTVENITGKKTKRLRCDNEKEYVIKDINKLTREKRIILDTCALHEHQLNDTAKHYNSSIIDTARYLL